MNNNQNTNVVDINSNSSVIRVVKNKNYTIMSNQHLKCKDLSLKAKGLMSLCLSLPEQWNYTISGLVALSVDGPDGVKSALKELRKTGFLNVEKTRNQKGVFVSTYTFFENPNENLSYKSLSSVTENPLPIENSNGENADNGCNFQEINQSGFSTLDENFNQSGFTTQAEPHRLNHIGSTDVVKPMLLNTNNKILKLNTEIISYVNSEEFTPADLFNLYKKICIHFPQPTKLTDERVKKTKLRLKAYPNVDFWETALKNAEKSNFCRKSRFVNFDWIIKNNSNPLKLFEQNYNNEQEQPTQEQQKNKYSKCYKG